MLSGMPRISLITVADARRRSLSFWACNGTARLMTIADNQSGDKATQIAALVTQETGSKDLFIDLDNSASQAARYVVVQSTPESKLPPGVVAVEIVLNHQP